VGYVLSITSSPPPVGWSQGHLSRIRQGKRPYRVRKTGRSRSSIAPGCSPQGAYPGFHLGGSKNHGWDNKKRPAAGGVKDACQPRSSRVPCSRWHCGQLQTNRPRRGSALCARLPFSPRPRPDRLWSRRRYCTPIQSFCQQSWHHAGDARLTASRTAWQRRSASVG
jgi:hypothetical protein